MSVFFFFFFFQAEDGIRDGRVTGVQTCALPISLDATGSPAEALEEVRQAVASGPDVADVHNAHGTVLLQDRKSTRLNSSHPSISYAVFCLKKKKKTRKNEI